MLHVVLFVASICWILIATIQLTRLQFLSKVIRADIDDVAAKRQQIIDNGGTWEDVCQIPYPNIDQSYKNLKWYKPWERPSNLVTFEKEN